MDPLWNKVSKLFSDNGVSIPKLLENMNRETIELIVDLNYSDIAKLNLLLGYVNYVNSDLKHDFEKLVVSISSEDHFMPLYPYWCLPNYLTADLVTTKLDSEIHYINRSVLLTNIGDINKKYLYKFVDNFDKMIYVDNTCLCSIFDSQPDQDSEKYDNYYTVKDKRGTHFKLKIYFRVDKLMPEIEIRKCQPRNPITTNITRKNSYMAVGSRSFTNDTIIGMILNMLLDRSNNFSYQYDAFICEKIGAHILSDTQKDNLHTLLLSCNPVDALEHCNNCLSQLIPILHHLKLSLLGFNHNNLTTENIYIDKNGNYIMSNFEYSSITWNKIRFHNNTYPVEDSFITYHGKDATELKPFNYDKIKYAPGGYLLCYDLYVLVTSMLLNTNVRKAIKTSEKTLIHKVCDILFTGQKEVVDLLLESKTRNIHDLLHSNDITIINDIDYIIDQLGLTYFNPSEKGLQKYKNTIQSAMPVFTRKGGVRVETQSKTQITPPPPIFGIELDRS
jgi:hypothetical protein